MFPCKIASELYAIFNAGKVENVIVPAVLNIISSPAAGMPVGSQLPAVVQLSAAPVPPFQVLVAAKLFGFTIRIISIKNKNIVLILFSILLNQKN